MPIDSVTPRLPSYQESIDAQPRSAKTEPPPSYFSAAHAERPSSRSSSRQVSSERPTNLTQNRIADFHSRSQANRGMNFMSVLSERRT